MRYYRGKGKCGKRIASAIIDYCNKNGFIPDIYIEPFCGMYGVGKHIAPLIKKAYANDISTDVIMLLKEVRSGKFKNPDITHEKWKILKDSKTHSAERAFAAHGCSFGGVPFNGYIKDPINNDMMYSSLIKMTKYLENTNFYSYDYLVFLKKILSKYHQGNKNILIYMDPPYKDTCNLKNQFDSAVFWDVVRHLAKLKGVKVLVSELSSPKDFKCIYSFDRRNGMHNTTSNKTVLSEKLYIA